MNYKDTLDPENWEKLRTIAHQAVDDSINYLINIRSEKAWEGMSDDDKDKFNSPAPLGPQPLEDIYHEFLNDILPYPMKTAHPRFWGWYMGNGSFTGSLADFLTSIMNTNAGGGNQIAQYLEDQVIQWMKEITKFPADSSGILVSGGSMANFVGLVVARHEKTDFDIRNHGLHEGGKQYAVYASSEVHSCNQKAVELLGLGSKFLRKVATNARYELDLNALEETIQRDKAEGIIPICVIASAGTVNTGAIDDLEAIADLCKQEDLWFHVDGAIGAIAMLSEKVAPRLKGMELADSVALDLHKWLHIPFEAGCTLIRDRKSHHSAFSLEPEYLAKNERGLASGSNWYSEYGLQLSRRARSLKVWMTIKEHGIVKFGRLITRNVLQAEYLGGLVNKSPHLQLMAPIELDIVCFRFIIEGWDDKELSQLNRQILAEIHEQGIAVPSYTTLEGRYCLRVAIANYRSAQEDFDLLVSETIRIGNVFGNRDIKPST